MSDSQYQITSNPYSSNTRKEPNSSDHSKAMDTHTINNSLSLSSSLSTVKDRENVMTFSQAFADVPNVPIPSDRTPTEDSETSVKIPPSSVAQSLPAPLQPHVLLVSMKQRGNPIIPFLRNVPYAYTEIIPDFILGSNRCALFLSLKYHNLYPHYIHRRIAELKSDYDLRILLCLVDLDDNASLLLLLNKICCVNNMTFLLSWSEQEAARYLETIKSFENKDASLIQKKKEATYTEQVAMTLSCVRSVTKTDAGQLLSTFSTLRNVFNASMDDLRLVPGIGDKKVKRLYDAFHKPFSSVMSKKRKMEASSTMEHMSLIHENDEDEKDQEEGQDKDQVEDEDQNQNVKG